MYGHLTTWRLRRGEDGDRLVADLAARLAEAEERLPAIVAGYAVLTGPDTLVTVNLYPNAKEAETATHAMALLALAVLDGRADPVAHEAGPAATIVPPEPAESGESL
jgi:hypothetical protein